MINDKTIRRQHAPFRLFYHRIALLTFVDDPKGFGCSPIHVFAKAEVVLPRAGIVEPPLSEKWRRADQVFTNRKRFPFVQFRSDIPDFALPGLTTDRVEAL